MRRVAFGFFAVCSLLLIAAFAVLWIRSHKYSGDGFQWADLDRRFVYQVGETGGKLVLARRSCPLSDRDGFAAFVGDPSPRYFRRLWVVVTPKPDFEFSLLGLHLAEGRDGDGGRLAYALIPYYVPVTAFFIVFSIPFIWRTASESRASRRRLHCRCTCGYNLTANTSGVCPECGTPVPAATPKSPRPE